MSPFKAAVKLHTILLLVQEKEPLTAPEFSVFDSVTVGFVAEEAEEVSNPMAAHLSLALPQHPL